MFFFFPPVCCSFQASCPVNPQRPRLYTLEICFHCFSWHSDWSAVQRHWKRWQQSLQQHRLHVLLSPVPHVYLTYAYCAHM